MFNATFNNNSVIFELKSGLLAWENLGPATSHWQIRLYWVHLTVSHNQIFNLVVIAEEVVILPCYPFSPLIWMKSYLSCMIQIQAVCSKHTKIKCQTDCFNYSASWYSVDHIITSLSYFNYMVSFDPFLPRYILGVGILLICWKHLHECIISVKGKCWAHKTSLTLPLCIEVPVPNPGESGHICVCKQYQFCLLF